MSLLAGYLLFTGTGGGGAGVQVILNDLEAVMAGEVEAEVEPVEIIAEVEGEVRDERSTLELAARMAEVLGPQPVAELESGEEEEDPE